MHMAIAPKIQLKQGQSLVMTPQLQQAIKLLQLSNIELSAYVDEQAGPLIGPKQDLGAVLIIAANMTRWPIQRLK